MYKMNEMNFSEEIPSGEELREIPGAGKQLPFKVPRGYFEDFPARLNALIEQENTPVREKKMRLADYLKPVIGLAASFAAIFMIVYWPAKLITHEQTASSTPPAEEQRIINLVEHVDDHTFLTLLEGESKTDTTDYEMLETYLAANYSDIDLYLEINQE